MNIVYWLHSNDETDILTEGYVGITKDLKTRMKAHKDKNRSYSVITFGSRYYCKQIEYKLRPHPNIGLNRAVGGGGHGGTNKGQIPWNKGSKGVMVAWNKGKRGAQVAWNKNKSWSEESKQKMSHTRLQNPNRSELSRKAGILGAASRWGAR